MMVEVYFNLHKKLFSIRALEGENAGRVIGHSRCVGILGAKFVVQQGGRERVLREKKKNVHAFIRGEIAEEWVNDQYFWGESGLETNPERFGVVSYNPYRAGSFQQVCGHHYRDITRAGLVCCYLNSDGKPTIVFHKDYGAEGPQFKYGGVSAEAV